MKPLPSLPAKSLRQTACFLGTLCLLTASLSAAPADVWPLSPSHPPEPAELSTIPPQLQSAAVFQTSFMNILAGKPEADWRSQLESLAADSAPEPVPQALRQLARVWLARAQMQRIDAALVTWYRGNVAFPASLDSLQLPPDLQRDPWGQPWAYSLHAPAGFAALSAQRYELGPASLPHLAGMKTALKDRHAAPPPGTVSPLQVAGSLALQFRSPAGLVAVIQPGGQVHGCTLVYAGQNWALLAGEDQLFSITF